MKKTLLLLHFALLAFWTGTGYLRSDMMFIVGLGVLLSVVQVRASDKTGPYWRYGALALLCAGLAFWVPARSFHFLALVFSAFFVLENHAGTINEAPAMVAVLLTAGAKTMSVVIGFPLRLRLSENAAEALQLLDSNAAAAGNLIHFRGQDFLVDTACTGLRMVEVSFLFGFFLLGLFERREQRCLRWPALLGMVAMTSLLILFFNQLRILLLVIFNIPPENPMHEAMGLFGLALYVFVPLWWILKQAFRHRLTSTQVVASSKWPMLGPKRAPQSGALLLGHVALTAVLLYFACFAETKALQQGALAQTFKPYGIPPDCRQETLNDGITKYANDQLLVYLKPVRGWYDTEHTPLICWQGSGYVFGQMQVRVVGKTAIYTGVLQKAGGPTYYTAWWFDNGKEKTNSQTRWRWLDATGGPGFSLVNVTAADKGALDTQLAQMLVQPY